MKIAIATQPIRQNYGGILQNYALQQVLIKLGHEPITLRQYYFVYSYKNWLQYSVIKFIKGIFIRHRFEKFLPSPHKLEIPVRGMNGFIDTHINSTKRFRNYSPKLLASCKADVLIVGSDQVWRPLYNGSHLYSMFGDFVPSSVPRIAYAASFGSAEWEYTPEQTERCKALLQRFSAVSVREECAVAQCEKYLSRPDAQWVLDPTMLLTRADYIKLAEQIPPQGDVLYAYILDVTPEKLEYIHRIASEKKLRAVIQPIGDSIKSSDSPLQWLANFRDAKFVVTDSFHGTAFSLIFNVDFVAITNTSRGNARFDSLCKAFDIYSQTVTDGQFTTTPPSPDWNEINRRMALWQTKSTAFLANALNRASNTTNSNERTESNIPN